MKGSVKDFKIDWVRSPQGDQGTSVARVNGKELTVRWRRDKDGFWLEFPDRVVGFDLRGFKNDEGRIEYEVVRRGYSDVWSGLRLMRDGEQQLAGSQGAVKKATKIRAQMPGKIVRVLVKSGDSIEKDQPLLVMEAMKMENEIRAPISGSVDVVKISDGQAVESGAELLILK